MIPQITSKIRRILQRIPFFSIVAILPLRARFLPSHMEILPEKGGGPNGMHYEQWTQCAELDWENGVFSVPLKWKRKTPVNKGWPNLRLGPGDFPDFIKPPCNRGRLLGIAPPEGVVGGWVVCVDLDTEAARLLAQYFLPPTGEIGGRTSRSCWF